MYTGYKIYTYIWKEKLDQEIFENNIYSVTQFGSRKGKGTYDAMCFDENAIEYQLHKIRKVYIILVDLNTVFDYVTRKAFRNVQKKY